MTTLAMINYQDGQIPTDDHISDHKYSIILSYPIITTKKAMNHQHQSQSLTQVNIEKCKP